MIPSFVISSKEKIHSISRVQALVSFTALAALLSPVTVYGMDIDDTNPQKILTASPPIAETELPTDFDQLKQLADQGDSKAQYKMAQEYEVLQDTENRVKYLTLAGRNPEANQAVDSEDQTPSKRALSELIVLSLNRKTNKIVNESGWGPLIGINMVDNKVLFEYFPSAKAGDVESQLKIARMLLKGNSRDSVLWMSKKGYSDGGYVKSYDIEALKYLNPAAAKNNIEAHQYLYAIHNRLQDCPQAFNHLKRAADLGNADAQFLVSEAYAKGEGEWLKKDDSEELKYLVFAAEQKHPRANTLLGLRYEYGQGVPEKNVTKALELYQIAANLGEPDAQRAIGQNHLEGGLLELDNELALLYLKRSADEQYNAIASYVLGVEYARGIIVPQDWKKAYEYCEAALCNKDNYAVYSYRPLYDKGLFRDQTFQIIKEVCFFLGEMYEEGKGCNENANRAISYYKDLVEKKWLPQERIPDVLRRIAKLYEKDGLWHLDKAAEYYKRAADLGNAEAQFAMGNCFDTGSNLYVKKDSAEALKYFKLAADQGHQKAQLKVAQINLLNEGK